MNYINISLEIEESIVVLGTNKEGKMQNKKLNTLF